MNEDNFNMDIRKFLKKVGINAQRQIEQAVLRALDENQLQGS
jgi:shikimate kinase